MLSRLLSGGEETSSILIVAEPLTSAAACSSLVKLLAKGLLSRSSPSSSAPLLVSTGPRVPDLECSEVVNLSEILDFPSWADPLVTSCAHSDKSVVIDNLTDLVLFYSHSQVTNFVRKFRQSGRGKLVAILHKNCLSNQVVDDVRRFFTTTLELCDTKQKTVKEKVCVIKHLKPGGKLVSSKEVLTFDSDWNFKINPFKEDLKKTFEEEEEEAIDKLTTFSLATNKEAEKVAKDNLVLPFYKEPQKAGEVKIQKSGPTSSASESEGKIYYEPDSGDDWDDEDPDDDLDF